MNLNLYFSSWSDFMLFNLSFQTKNELCFIITFVIRERHCKCERVLRMKNNDKITIHLSQVVDIYMKTKEKYKRLGNLKSFNCTFRSLANSIDKISTLDKITHMRICVRSILDFCVSTWKSSFVSTMSKNKSWHNFHIFRIHEELAVKAKNSHEQTIKMLPTAIFC